MKKGSKHTKKKAHKKNGRHSAAVKKVLVSKKAVVPLQTAPKTAAKKEITFTARKGYWTALVLVLIFTFMYSLNRKEFVIPFPSPSFSPEATVLTPSPEPTPNPAERKEVRRFISDEKIAVFTFDAGNITEGSAEQILAALKKHRVKGTFFVVGTWALKHQDLTKRLIAEGHEVFNHSNTHPYFTKLTADEVKDELQKMDDTLFGITGTRTRPYFRAPYGDRNEATNDAAFSAGFQSIYWSVDSLDWRPEDTPATVKSRVLNNIHPGAIVLMHIGNESTGPVIDEIFTTLEEQGYTLLSLTEAMERASY
jgi:peptidoglycan/xylan/chitin deacetylase (PgdA/CDA1 family)